MVESGHGGEALGWEVWGVSLADQGVSVGRVADDDGFGITGAVVVDGFADIHEDLAVILEKVATLHTWSTRLGSNQEVVVDVLESCAEVAGDDDFIEKRESAVMKLSLDSLEDLLLEWKVEQVEDDSLVLAKEFTTKQSKIRSIAMHARLTWQF